MATITQSSARAVISVAEAADIALMAGAGSPAAGGPAMMARGDLQAMLGNSALVLDGQRTRPRFFDGRFLTGADLTRDQDYIRQRQNDLARASGTGVIDGLQVSAAGVNGGEAIVIQPGHGVTPTGDIVMVTQPLTLSPLDMPTVQKLDFTLGLSLQPRQPLGRRTGLFLLTLRSVEFTANPIAAYPTTISGPRQVQDGDIIEATAITLIPWPDTGGAATLAEARRAAARGIFLGEAQGLPQDALVLAMIAMDHGSIAWIDAPMVRREAGSDTPLQVSLGSRPRALAEAFVLQYRTHLNDTLTARANAGLTPVFAASQYFAALPAAGQLPAACVLTDTMGFRQTWFPPAIDADLSFVPVDELPALIEESLTLPPIDLLADPADLQGTGVVILAPVSRDRMRSLDQALASLSANVITDPGAGLRRPPVDALAALLARRGQTGPIVSFPPIPPPAADPATSTWQAAWAAAVSALPTQSGLPPMLWYVRRRAVAYESRISGVSVTVTGDDTQTTAAMTAHLTALGLLNRVKAIEAAATPAAVARITNLFARPALLGSTMLTAALLQRLEAAAHGASASVSPAAAAALPAAAASMVTRAATITAAPTIAPTGAPTIAPTIAPTGAPTIAPTGAPTTAPTGAPTTAPTGAPATAPTGAPTTAPAGAPTTGPTSAPTTAPTGGSSTATPSVPVVPITPVPIVPVPITPVPVIPAPPGVPVTDAMVIAAATGFDDPRLGDGLTRLLAAFGATPLGQAGEVWAGGSGQALTLDAAVRPMADSVLPNLAAAVRKAAADQNVTELITAIANAG